MEGRFKFDSLPGRPMNDSCLTSYLTVLCEGWYQLLLGMAPWYSLASGSSAICRPVSPTTSFSWPATGFRCNWWTVILPTGLFAPLGVTGLVPVLKVLESSKYKLGMVSIWDAEPLWLSGADACWQWLAMASCTTCAGNDKRGALDILLFSCKFCPFWSSSCKEQFSEKNKKDGKF